MKYLLLAWLLLPSLAFAEEKVKKTESPTPSTSTSENLYWGGEICVLYDYRRAITKGLDLSPNLFAIEVKNHNGGSIEKKYPKEIMKKGAKSKGTTHARLQLLKAQQDIVKLVDKGRCDRMEIFYPDKDKEESEI